MACCKRIRKKEQAKEERKEEKEVEEMKVKEIGEERGVSKVRWWRSGGESKEG